MNLTKLKIMKWLTTIHTFLYDRQVCFSIRGLARPLVGLLAGWPIHDTFVRFGEIRMLFMFRSDIKASRNAVELVGLSIWLSIC